MLHQKENISKLRLNDNDDATRRQLAFEALNRFLDRGLPLNTATVRKYFNSEQLADLVILLWEKQQKNNQLTKIEYADYETIQ
jgi:hypothetical protein